MSSVISGASIMSGSILAYSVGNENYQRVYDLKQVDSSPVIFKPAKEARIQQHIQPVFFAYIKNTYVFLNEQEIDEIIDSIAAEKLVNWYNNNVVFEIEKEVPIKYKIIKEEHCVQEYQQKIKEHEENIMRLKNEQPTMDNSHIGTKYQLVL